MVFHGFCHVWCLVENLHTTAQSFEGCLSQDQEQRAVKIKVQIWETLDATYLTVKLYMVVFFYYKVINFCH